MAGSKQAGIAIDDWKLPVFKRHLEAAGYEFDGVFQLVEDTLMLLVSYDWEHELQPVIEAATRECAERKAELTGGRPN